MMRNNDFHIVCELGVACSTPFIDTVGLCS